MSEPTLRQNMINEVKLRLGDGMIDIELDPQHFELAVTVALDRYRMRSGNAMEESFVFMDVQPDVAVYTLPNEVQEVLDIYRRNIGATGGGGASVDPFSLAFTNNLYMVQGNGGLAGGGGLATYELGMQYINMIGRMFGRELQYTWNVATKKLLIHRKFGAAEQILLHCYNTKPEEVLFADPYARPWLRDYIVAYCKLMLGEGRGLYGSLAGPQGGITLNADAIRQEAKDEMDRLEQEIVNMVDGHMGMPFCVG